MMKICSFSGARRIGKPKDWDESLDGGCLDIFVADGVDTLSGLPVQYTIYQMSPEELAALASGGVFRLGIVGHQPHPVFNFAILSAATIEGVDIEPCGELGGVI